MYFLIATLKNLSEDLMLHNEPTLKQELKKKFNHKLWVKHLEAIINSPRGFKPFYKLIIHTFYFPFYSCANIL